MSVYNTALFDTAALKALQEVRVGLVHTEWNAFIVDEMVNGCRRVLDEMGVAQVDDMVVPGSVEIPFACKRYYESARTKDQIPEVIIAFGCVIRGDTPHFDYVCQAVTQGITQLNLSLPLPVIFGILTVDDVNQAKERIGGTHGHKGEEAALTALKMVALNRKLS